MSREESGVVYIVLIDQATPVVRIWMERLHDPSVWMPKDQRQTGLKAMAMIRRGRKCTENT